MTRKPSLYACIAALTVAPVTAPVSAAERPPCGACVHAAVRPADWDPGYAGTVVLVVSAAEAIAGGAKLERARTILLELQPEASVDETSFAARRALAAVRGASPAARVGVVAPPALLDPLLAEGLSAYTDILAAPGVDGETVARWQKAHAGLEVWTTIQLTSFERLLEESRASVPGATGALIWPPAGPAPQFLEDLATFASLFPDRLVPGPDTGARCEPAGACRVEWFERADTHEGIVVIEQRGEGTGAVVLRAARADMFAIVSQAGASAMAAGAVLSLAPAIPDASGAIALRVPRGASHLIARLPPPEDAIVEDVSVVGTRHLSVDEIVARHQAQAARQSAVVRALVTHARTTVTFEVPAFPAPVTIEAETILFETSTTKEVAQRNIRVNGVAFSEKNFPRLPVVEPERVAAPPLAITLNRAYGYRLDGRGRVDGRDAYVVSFEPADDRATLFKGRAWIDAATFGVLRIDAVQTNVRGPFTSSQQIEEFVARRAGSETVWLLARSEVRQVYQGAGVTTPIHRVMVVDRHDINPADLAERRQAAQAGAVVLRDAGEGLRYAQGGRATRVVTLAGGVLIDPNITRPLPFAGVNFSDFNFAGVGAQVNAFFGGAYGQFAFSVPSVAGSRWQLAGAGFAMLARYNDRSFRAGRERYDENLAQRPAHASAGLIRPLSARTSARAEYVLDYVSLERNDSTSAAFVVPVDQVVHGARLSIETQRAGWRLAGWWNPARRAGWRPWGVLESSDYRPQDRDFQRAGASASRPWLLGRRVLARVETAWMAGRDLDRFSRYGFDSFENRLRGYPSASVRYDRGGVLRTAIVAQPAGRVRLDGFADVAVVREPGFGRALRTYPGVGAAVETPGPFGLLLGAEWGFGFQGLNGNGTRGTQVIRITGYKIF